jgi:pyochelin synthetase
MQDLVKDRLAQLSAEKRAWLALRLSRSQGGSTIAAAPSGLRPDRAARHEPFPLKDLQQAYWVGRDKGFTLGGVAGHSYYEIDLCGVNVPRIAAAWNRLIERHDMLRAVIHPDGRQQVLEQLPSYEIAEIDLRGLAPEEVACRLAELRDTMSHQVLPSDRWPLFDVRAVRLTAERVRLFISLDALFIDGWSMALLFREWRQLMHDPAAVLAPLDLSFRDYVLAEREREQSEAHRKAEEYWRERLTTLPSAPELPLACNPEAVTQP